MPVPHHLPRDGPIRPPSIPPAPAGTAALQTPPPRQPAGWRPRFGILLVYAVGVAVLMLGPEAIQQSLYSGEFTARVVNRLEFEAMPVGYRDQLVFSLQTPDGRDRIRCAALLPEFPEAVPRYRCERTVRQSTSELGYRELMPREDGWRYRAVEGASSLTVVDIEQTSAGLWMLPSILLAALALWWLRRRAAPEPRCPFRLAVVWVIAMLALYLLISYVLSPWVSASDLQISDMMQREVRRQPWLLASQVVIFGPVLEELVFRGAGWALLRRVFPLGVVVTLTTATFTIGHSHDWAGALGIISAGLILAWIRIRTGSVLWCIVAHAAMNAMALLFWYFGT